MTETPSTYISLLLALWMAGCGIDAEERFAGMESLWVDAGGVSYRLRYMEPWKPVRNDPLLTEDGRVQWGAADADPAGDTRLRDLAPAPGSARVLEIERTGKSATNLPSNVAVYPKYRLEVAVLRCDDLEINVPQADSCAEHLNVTDEANRSATELSGFFGAEGREGENAFGQRYYEFMTRVVDSGRFRRVVYFETSDRAAAVRLGFEASPALSEREVDQMIDAFQLFDDAASASSEARTSQGGT